MTEHDDFYSDHEEDLVSQGDDEEAYSPTDGYFSQRDHPQQVYVDQPTSSTTHAKELEAAEESQSSRQAESTARDSHDTPTVYTPSSPTRYTPSSPTRSLPHENTPLLRPPSLYDAPPPAYSADQPAYGANQPSYQSISAPEVAPVETQTIPFFASGPPQSMGRPPIEFDTERNLYRKPPKSNLSRLCGSVCKTFWAFIIIAGLVWLWAVVFLADSDDHHEGKGDMDTPEEVEPNLPKIPKWPSQCDHGNSTETYFDFDTASSFSFDEYIESQELFGGIYGRVTLTAAPSGQSAPIRVNITASTSNPYSIKALHIQMTNDGISLMSPEIERQGRDIYDSSWRPCMVISANVFVKPGITLEKLDIGATNLEISLTDSLQVTVGKTYLETMHTRISSESKFDSRETRIRTGSSSISGHYNLLDLLEVSSQSGSISIDVTPKNASKENNPAKLNCSTHSGSLAVHMPREDSAFTDLPKRDYQTLIKTDVGSISGNYIHGTKTEFYSQTGSISTTVLPYSADGYESKLVTSTTSSMTYIDLKSPYSGKTIKRMKSTHTTKSGSLHLNYPQEWEGNIKGSTTTGSLVLKGKDVQVERFDDGWVSKAVSAHKGKGDLEGKLTFNTLTGSADVTIGDVVGRQLDYGFVKDSWRGAPIYREE